MAISLVGTPTSAAGASVSSSSLSITVPTGSVGDVIFIHFAASGVSTTAGAPVITPSQTGWFTIWSVTDTLLATKVFYRFVQAGDPASYTFTTSASANLAVDSVRYSGLSSATPFRFLNVTEESSSNSPTFTSITFPPVDNVNSTDLTLCFVAGGTATSNKIQAAALATPSGWTNVVNTLGATSATTSSLHLAMATYSKVGGTDTPTISGATAGTQAAISLVLIDSDSTDNPLPGGGMTFVNSASTGQSAISGTIAVNVPSGVVNGDLMLAAASNPSGNGVWSAPAGWEPIPVTTNCSESQGTTSQLADVDAGLWYKFASSEPASYTFTVSRTNHGNAAAIVAYRGLRNPYPIHMMGATKSESSGNTSSTTSPAPYSLNTLNVITADMLIVNFYCCGNDASGGAITITLPSSPWTSRVTASATIASTFNGALGIADKLGATDIPTATAGVACGWVVFSVALVGTQLARQPLIMPFALKRSAYY